MSTRTFAGLEVVFDSDGEASSDGVILYWHNSDGVGVALGDRVFTKHEADQIELDGAEDKESAAMMLLWAWINTGFNGPAPQSWEDAEQWGWEEYRATYPDNSDADHFYRSTRGN